VGGGAEVVGAGAGRVAGGSTMTAAPYDPAKAEAFAGRMVRALNDGALCLMTSIGHRTGLFDAMTGAPPLTSAELAERARKNERYVREWLGAMAAAGVVTVDAADPERPRFTLPPEHAASLTRAAAGDNAAMPAQFIALFGEVESEIVACFESGGGVPYERFARFHQVMADDDTLLQALEPHVLPLVPGLVERLESGIDVLDAGCGAGRVLLALAERFPNSRFTGMDLSQEAVARGRAGAQERGLSNVRFEVRDLSDFDQTAEPGRYDLVTTFDAIHDQAQPFRVLVGIRQTLRPGGVYLMQDINGTSRVDLDVAHPMGTFLYTASCMHCMTVSLAQGGEGLGAMWGEAKTRDYLARAGFGAVETHTVPRDVNNLWYVIRA
jgi:2-polyprenyl-3-methyl-5-hydroxy-6-metoxy-1,4-benzoquinol methylase